MSEFLQTKRSWFMNALDAYAQVVSLCHHQHVKSCKTCIMGARIRWIHDMLRGDHEPKVVIQDAIIGIDALFEHEKCTKEIDGVTYLKGDKGNLMETFRHLMKQALATAEREDMGKSE